MNQYIYPQNLKASAKLWFWNLKDIAVLGIALLISILALSQIRLILPLALTLVYGFLTIRLDDISVLDFIKRAFCFFVSAPQYFEWNAGKVCPQSAQRELQNQKKNMTANKTGGGLLA